MNPTSTKRKKRKSSDASGNAMTSSITKRKRQSTSYETVSFRVHKPNPKRDPILVSFPGGVPAPSSSEEAPQFLWSQLNPKSKEGRYLEGKEPHGTCVYRAAIQGDGFDERRTKMCIGIYDKQTGIVTVHQAASRGTVYALQQHLPSYKESIKDENQSNSLFADFGSAKKRKTLKSMQANRVNVETVIGSGSAIVDVMMDNETAAAGGGRLSLSNRRAVEEARLFNQTGNAKVGATDSAIREAHLQARKTFLPPFDTKTGDAEKIYNFRSIGGSGGFDRFSRTLDTCLKENGNPTDFFNAITRGKPDKESGDVKPPEERGWTKSVLESLRLASSKMSADGTFKSATRYQLQCVMMLHYLIKFYHKFQLGTRGNRGRILAGMEEGQPRWYGIPRDMALHWLNLFATERQEDGSKTANPLEDQRGSLSVPKYMMSKIHRDKCLIHLLLIYLFARGGQKMSVADLQQILSDLDVDAKEAGQLLRMAGCNVSVNASTKTTKASLKAPLVFPQPKRMMRGGAGKGR